MSAIHSSYPPQLKCLRDGGAGVVAHARGDAGAEALAPGGTPISRTSPPPQAADDALVAIMRRLHTFRGDSRFTTWAYKFALLEAGMKVRRRAWQGREVPLEEDGWAQLRDRRASPGADAETAELLAAVRDHDARKKLKARLAADGLSIDSVGEGRTA
jgi:hypothetical protein